MMVPRFVVLITDNEGGGPNKLFDTLEAAKAWLREIFLDPKYDTQLTPWQIERMDGDLADVDGIDVAGVRGCDAIKEWAYIAPIDQGEEG